MYHRMPTEIEEFIEDEESHAERETDAGIERDFKRESPEEAWFEYGEREDAAEEALEPGLWAVLDQKGGEEDDWTLEYKGDSGYRFDGENVRDPDGKIWMNEDAALHQEMLAQWTEGGSSIFFLPDHRESDEDRETLYVTMMILGERGEVTYEIRACETPKTSRDDGAGSGEKNGPDRWLADLLDDDTGLADVLSQPDADVKARGLSHESRRSEDDESLERAEEEPLRAAEGLKAADILRALGMPAPAGSAEAAGSRRMRDDPPSLPPARNARIDRSRDARFARTSERNGVTMKMAASGHV